MHSISGKNRGPKRTIFRSHLNATSTTRTRICVFQLFSNFRRTILSDQLIRRAIYGELKMCPLKWLNTNCIEVVCNYFIIQGWKENNLKKPGSTLHSWLVSDHYTLVLARGSSTISLSIDMTNTHTHTTRVLHTNTYTHTPRSI